MKPSPGERILDSHCCRAAAAAETGCKTGTAIALMGSHTVESEDSKELLDYMV